MASLWTQASGATLATLQERGTTTVNLPLADPSATVTHISGELPRGMRLNNNQIVGTPFQVARETIFKFVLRANLNGLINDRTFNIVIQGADEPVWTTKEDLLPVGLAGQYFILDSAPVDFQLEAYDADTVAGQNLEYFIGSRDGILPPGLSLSKTGKISGIVDPILAITKASAAGYYDDAPYDMDSKIGYDWSVRSNNGFASFYYDTTVYDLSIPTRSPKKLNRYYQFTVSITDGDTIAKRTFRIYVVGDDFFRSDTTVMQVGEGIFTADVSHVRAPIWLTPTDFGYRRANNYITLVLDIIDPNSITGVVTYNLESKNDDGSDSVLPPGLDLDSTSGEIAGYTPYQPAITKEYKFTVNAKRIDVDEDQVQFLQYAYEATPKNVNEIKVNKLGEYADKAIGLSFSLDGYGYKIINTDLGNANYDIIVLDKALHKSLEKGFSLDLGTIAVIEQEIAQKAKTFTVKLLGEVDSTIQWLTPENLGNISSNYISTLSVLAQTTVPNARLIYSLESGTLPPGLSLSYDGEIIGKINSFGTADKKGLTVFDSQELVLDGNTTTVDRKYTFTIKAQDQFGFSAISRIFTVTVDDPDDKLYSNLYVQPLMKSEKRRAFDDIMNDANIFEPDYIYRPNDPNFGLQRKLKMLMYAGIETLAIDQYVAAAAKNHKRKRFKIGEVKTAIAKTPGTNDVVYEVVYVEVIDPYEPTSGKTKKKISIKNTQKQLINSVKYTPTDLLYDTIPNTFKIAPRAGTPLTFEFDSGVRVYKRSYVVSYPTTIELLLELRDGSSVSIPFDIGTPVSNIRRPEPANTITVDSDAIKVNEQNDQTRYISNVTNMRDAIRELGVTERNFLPLWMRTPQADNVNELGFVTGIPIVYCKPGTAEIIKNNIRLSNIDFSQFDFDIDRYIIDSTTGNSEDQYILFANYKFNI
jgi:hypothetical protein